MNENKVTTRSDTSMWLLGQIESLQFWPTSDNLTDDVPDMTGRQLPTVLSALKHVAYLRHIYPKRPIRGIAQDTCEVISIYWKMAKIPVQEISDTKAKFYYAADRLTKCWSQFLVRI